MGFPVFVLEHVLLAILLAAQLMNIIGMAQASPFDNPVEKDALHGLKATFNDPFLNSNWIGFLCNETETSRWFGIQCASGRVTGIVLEGMELTGEIDAKAFFNLTELSILSFKNNSLKGNLMDFSDNNHLKYIDLSGNELDGAIPISLLNLNLLEALLLQDNKLTGPVPAFCQPSLKMINVSGNDLHGSIRATRTFPSLGPDSFSGNPRLCGPPLNSCSSSLKAAI
ncbi:pollen receptor-like kinase 4 [Neltuma alba]|uniref:pollen receptor-like kinase 4 n=1 Tax=Neltuma alba TaxID=207710 RepID=UPI0010A483B5|nr:pollen receptor-like kinase 4 [Prosopis alba]